MEPDELEPRAPLTLSRSFVTENDVVKERETREMAFEQARMLNPSLVRHDLLPDGSIKPLHVQLAQNKAAKQEEWDAAHAFKNQIYTLAEEDVEFVEQVRDRQEKEEREKRDQLNAFRDMVKQRAVASAPVVPGIDEPSQTQTQQKKQVDVQKKLLGAVRVKRKEEAPKSEEEPPAKVPKAEEAPKSAETTKAVETKSAAKDAPPATNALGLAYGDSDDE